MQFQSGDYIWAKTNKTYWPGIVLLPTHIGKPVKLDYEWVYWFGDGRISEVAKSTMLKFHLFFEEHTNNPDFFYAFGKRRFVGMIEALKFYRRGISEPDKLPDESENGLLRWALTGFPGINHNARNEIPNEVFYNIQIKQIGSNNMFDKSPKNSASLKKGVLSLGISKMCISCYHDEVYISHPVFEGGLCFECKERYIQRFFMIGTDNIHYCCAICCSFGDLLVCSAMRCGLSFCYECIDNLALPGLRKFIVDLKWWTCFVCNPTGHAKSSRYIKCRTDWMEHLHALYNTHRRFPIPHIRRQKERLRVLSLFDGISTGLIALEQLNLDVEIYYAAELDANAKNIVMNYHHDKIVYLGNGNVRKIGVNALREILPIHLVLGGSPCNDLSRANPVRKGLFDMDGSGILFFEFYRIISHLKKKGNASFFWLYENVASMPVEAKNIITRFLECQPCEVNSACCSPQQRLRYFWGNCPSLHANFSYDGDHSLQEYLNPGRTATVDTIRTITTNFNSLLQGSSKHHAVLNRNMEYTSLTINEIEKIFGLPLNYTKYGNLSKSVRLSLIGRAWSVQTICLLLHFLKYFYKLRT